ncbi:tripartite tricarboxylate transporter substrate binding protein [Ramlibacter sp. XY19]|uniref:Bug family tripartite tricarboxylate transporter substrate binding protein n=1 Tax=Ramlibacter paludis TaxID=2908000 RepID=UPI0023DA6656|nr:tripartite tricarboxylate transporter substrate binding protein [Ramlibacter paludis]MCG2592318.1 tripartite tricarboxylate transporter substrate binding protein [Ramlibacter paludis]
MTFRLRRRELFALASAAIVLPARAQSGVLRIIVPFTPGGSSDILARAIAPGLSAAIGQPIVVDNKPGAGGSIAAAEAAKAAPDGNTLFMGHLGTLAVNPWLYPKAGYDPLTSFATVGQVATVPNVLVVSAGSPVRTLKDFVELARRKPGSLTYSSGGNGSAAHMAFEALKLRTKITTVHIPYRGTVPAVTDLLGGQVDTTFTGVTVLLPHIKSGRLRALAVSSAQRIPSLPDVPTVAESGYPGFEADQWYGLVAPANTPPARVQKLNAELNKVLASPAVAQQLAGEGAIAAPRTPEAFRELIARELPRWGAVVKAANMTAS